MKTVSRKQAEELDAILRLADRLNESLIEALKAAAAITGEPDAFCSHAADRIWGATGGDAVELLARAGRRVEPG